MKVADMSIEDFKAFVNELIEEKLKEILGDPDSGLELKEEVKERLRRSFEAEARGERGIPVEELAKKLGLEW